jgi:hypothetical protein
MIATFHGLHIPLNHVTYLEDGIMFDDFEIQMGGIEVDDLEQWNLYLNQKGINPNDFTLGNLTRPMSRDKDVVSREFNREMNRQFSSSL